MKAELKKCFVVNTAFFITKYICWVSVVTSVRDDIDVSILVGVKDPN